MNEQKKMYKVFHTVDKRGGGTYWMRVGSAFTNRDDSLNVYLDAMPPSKAGRYELHIRELDADDLRRRDSSSTSSPSSNPSSGASRERDYGGIGAGPSLGADSYSTRAVTANGSTAADGDSVPF